MTLTMTSYFEDEGKRLVLSQITEMGDGVPLCTHYHVETKWVFTNNDVDDRVDVECEFGIVYKKPVYGLGSAVKHGSAIETKKVAERYYEALRNL
mmetsp:Transcript_8095/g.9927  ORF Transcript_8095/g.9927 Transcript_8095/m.9927 type:complete len:95 (-) Transcript_8095:79-363(-)